LSFDSPHLKPNSPTLVSPLAHNHRLTEDLKRRAKYHREGEEKKMIQFERESEVRDRMDKDNTIYTRILT
jgi:hypothetical protein